MITITFVLKKFKLFFNSSNEFKYCKLDPKLIKSKFDSFKNFFLLEIVTLTGYFKFIFFSQKGSKIKNLYFLVLILFLILEREIKLLP